MQDGFNLSSDQHHELTQRTIESRELHKVAKETKRMLEESKADSRRLRSQNHLLEDANKREQAEQVELRMRLQALEKAAAEKGHRLANVEKWVVKLGASRKSSSSRPRADAHANGSKNQKTKPAAKIVLRSTASKTNRRPELQ